MSVSDRKTGKRPGAIGMRTQENENERGGKEVYSQFACPNVTSNLIQLEIRPFQNKQTQLLINCRFILRLLALRRDFVLRPHIGEKFHSGFLVRNSGFGEEGTSKTPRKHKVELDKVGWQNIDK